MSKLPTVTSREAIQAFGRAGFEVARQESSHVTMKKPGHPYVLTIPDGGKRDLARGTLRRLIRDAGLTVDDFADLLG